MLQNREKANWLNSLLDLNSSRESPQGSDLSRLRKRITKVTQEIMDLAKEREHLSEQISKIKLSRGLLLEDLARESQLLGTMKWYAKRIGLEEKTAVRLTNELIQASKRVQRKKSNFKEAKDFLHSEEVKSVAIIGAGRMGRWFGDYFSKLVSQVTIFDRNWDTASILARELGCKASNDVFKALSSDLILLSLPIRETARIVEKFEKAFNEKRGKINLTLNEIPRLIEISSVKGPLLGSRDGRRNDGSRNLDVISIHPLFGPSFDFSNEGTIIYVTSSGDEVGAGGTNRRNLRFIKRLFPSFHIISMNLKDHEELMGLLLGLPHALAIAFGITAIDWLEAREAHSLITSPSMGHLLRLLQNVLSQNPDIYFEIQSLNSENTLEITHELIKSIEKLREIIKQGNSREFKLLLERIRGSVLARKILES